MRLVLCHASEPDVMAVLFYFNVDLLWIQPKIRRISA
jgi:hypothetical protein